MGNPHSHSLFLSITIIFSIHTLQYCSASSSSSSSIASDNLKFWSQNVQNPMPKSILKKLSPLTQKDSNYYTSILSTKGDKFRADANFCSLANLACNSVFDNVKRLDNSYPSNTYESSSGLHQMMNHQDPFSFFRQSILKKGNIIHLPNLQDSLPDRAFLPPQIVADIHISQQDIFKMFPESAVGKSKQTVEATLSACNAAPITGETKGCPKLLQEMVGFAKSTLGKKKLWALTSKIESDGSSSEMMMIRKMKEYPVEKIVACHEAFLPFAAYFCHSLPSTRLYAVELVGSYKKKEIESVNTMLAICHMDTSSWPKNHVAFQILKFGPGEGEACHWFTNLDLAWISGESV